MTDYEKAQMKRAWKHSMHALFWSTLALIPMSMLLALANADKEECQITGLVVTIIILILTNPPPLKPPGPDVKDLKP